MDLERELIRAENWSELKKLYSSKTGASWELGWLALLKDKDTQKAVSYFSQSRREAHHEEASTIILRKLGQKSLGPTLECSPSFRIFEAYESGDFNYIHHFLIQSRDHERYFASLMGSSIEKLTERDLVLVEKFSRPAGISLRLAVHCDRKLKNHSWAGIFYREYFANPWSRRVLEEARRLFLDAETGRNLRSAYAQHDAISARRILKSLAVRLANVSEQSITHLWRTSFKKAIEWEIDHLSENITSFPFWNFSEFSARSLHLISREMFLEEKYDEPASLRFWKEFFSKKEWLSIPTSIDPDSLSLWQIRVELDHELLREALLRFPSEERFLFLWSLKQKEPAEFDPRRWPGEQKESAVLRKNLERAFDQAKDKIIWFDRLRKSGCSQDFYEYVVGRCRIPVAWILKDLDSGIISTSPVLRGAIRDQLSTLVPEQEKAFVLSARDFRKALSLLTPAEMQQVLLSRYVISEIPDDFLCDEYADLFWDARAKVEPETFERWKKSVLDFLSSKPMRSFQARHWQWIEASWETQPDSLDRFSPSSDLNLEFPWDLYFDLSERHGREDILLKFLHRIPDERLKESWLHRLTKDHDDPRLFAAIHTLKTDYVRFALLAEWYERSGEWVKALKYREEELDTCPIMNDQLNIARRAIAIARKAGAQSNPEIFESLLRIGRFLEINGGLDATICRELSLAAHELQQWDQAWKWAQQEWSRSSEAERGSLLEYFSGAAFQARSVEDAQRILVDYIFKSGQPNELSHKILDQLLSSDSSFKIRHLRREFIDRATQIFPLHPEVLKVRASYDYRAVLLWKAFYGDEIEIRAEPLAPIGRRKFELWGLTDSSTQIENFSKLGRYIETVSRVKSSKDKWDFLDDAKRIAHRLSKHFGYRKGFEVIVTKDLGLPFQILVSQPAIQVNAAFFEELDEEIWGGICVGTLQVLQDFERGLYEPRRLIERFFQGMFLAGTPIASVIRFWVWIAIYENLTDPQILKSNPEKLVATLPFINSLLIFYLSDDFESKAKSCGLVPT